MHCFQARRLCIIDISFVSLQANTPASYTKYVAREMSKAEHLLKVMRVLVHGCASDGIADNSYVCLVEVSFRFWQHMCCVFIGVT